MSLNKSYDLLIDKRFEKHIKKNLPKELKSVLDRKLKYLSKNISHPSLNTKHYNASARALKKLGVDEVYEFRINMGFRCVLYVLHKEKQIIIAYVGSHEQLIAKYS